jgi:hypothetical protein
MIWLVAKSKSLIIIQVTKLKMHYTYLKVCEIGGVDPLFDQKIGWPAQHKINLVVGKKHLKFKFKKMNSIVGKEKPQVEVQKVEFGSRKKNIESKFKKMNSVG